LINHGQEEVGAAPEPFWCDILEFREQCSLSSAAAALQLYRGPFFEGLFVENVSPDLEEFIAATRAGARLEASRMAWLESGIKSTPATPPERFGREGGPSSKTRETKRACAG
ncbi:MAG: hypothetical protein ABI647_20105, partial [Gemmatimonadota bacterium]